MTSVNMLEFGCVAMHYFPTVDADPGMNAYRIELFVVIRCCLLALNLKVVDASHVVNEAAKLG